ncbi:MAG: hypothetical protein P1P64_04030 [Treponemataceae bacterium]
MDFLTLLEEDFDVLELQACNGHCSWVHHGLGEPEEHILGN